MKSSNLENHWFSLGITYILQNRRVLKLVEQVVENVIKKDAKVHLKTIQKFNTKSTCRKISEKYGRSTEKIENGCPKWSRNQQNVVKIKVQKTGEKT